jgi:DNA-binding CsgD family transcriptional regulator
MPRILDGHLSAGQLAALRLAACGYTSRQIAGRLGTTEQGIHVRLTTAAASLGARSRTHAVVIALACGLLRFDELELPQRGGAGAQEAAGARLTASKSAQALRDAPPRERRSGGRAAGAA